jgi:hypothetical protein
MTINSFATLAAVTLLASHGALAQNADRKFDSITQRDGHLEVRTSDGSYLIKPYSTGIIETTFVPTDETADPASHAVVLAPGAVNTTLKQKGGTVEYATAGIKVTITKSPFKIVAVQDRLRLQGQAAGIGKAWLPAHAGRRGWRQQGYQQRRRARTGSHRIRTG